MVWKSSLRMKTSVSSSLLKSPYAAMIISFKSPKTIAEISEAELNLAKTTRKTSNEIGFIILTYLEFYIMLSDRGY